MQQRMDDARFTQLSHFLRDPLWEGTNNGAERMGRTYRHLQTPRFGLRTDEAREGALVAHAMHRHHRHEHTARPPANRCTRGRKRTGTGDLTIAA